MSPLLVLATICFELDASTRCSSFIELQLDTRGHIPASE